MIFDIFRLFNRQNNFQTILENYIRQNDDIFFIQIGSNDGITGDPIHDYIVKYKWSGILVEPVRYLYKKLLKTYENRNNLFFENVAIAEKEGYKKFYRIEKNNELQNPFWYDQIGSFNKQVVLKHKSSIPNFNKHLIEEQVQCITFPQLLEKYMVHKVDILCIDTEGYDFNIIKSINFKLIKPNLIYFEHKHLHEASKAKCMDILKNENYSIQFEGFDVLAYL